MELLTLHSGCGANAPR